MPSAAYFEVFRSTSKDFKAETGTYVTSVSVNHAYDQAVRSGLSRTYYYTVRAVLAGKKSSFPAPVQTPWIQLTWSSSKTLTWVKFHITGGVGPNVGLSEIEVLVP